MQKKRAAVFPEHIDILKRMFYTLYKTFNQDHYLCKILKIISHYLQ